MTGPPSFGHQPAANQPAPGPSDGTGEPVRQPRRLTLLVLVLVLLLAALAGGGLGFYLRSGNDSAEQAVRRYFGALGMNTKAAEVAELVTNPPTPDELTTARALYPTGPTTFTITSISMRGSRATVQYSASGRAEQVELDTRRENGRYKIVDGFPSIRLTSRAELRLGTQKIDDQARGTPVLPGTYRLSVAPGTQPGSSSLDIEGETTVTVKPGEHKQQDVPVKLNQNGIRSVRSAVGSAFTRCLTTEASPPGCPFAVTAPADLDPRSVGTNRWRMADISASTRVADNADVDPSQPFDAVCTTFEAEVFYSYYGAGGRKQIPAPQNSYTGCANLTEQNPTVTWKR